MKFDCFFHVRKFEFDRKKFEKMLCRIASKKSIFKKKQYIENLKTII